MHFSRPAAVAQLLAASLVLASPVKRQTPSTVQSAGGYTYMGCASDPNLNGYSGRALIDNGTDVSSMTIEYCASYCGASNYNYFGLEYYEQCYCGNTLQQGTIIEADDSNCTLPCNGDSTEYCGGNWHLNLYGLPSTSSSTGSSASSSSSSISATAATTSSSSTSIYVATSTLAAATTTTATLTTSAASSSTTYAGTVQCPASNGTTFTTGGQVYQIQCYVDHNGGDVSNTQTNSMDDCLTACSNTNGCTDVSWVPGTPGTCYMKTSVTTGVSNTGVWGAILVSGSSSGASTSSTSSAFSSSSTSSIATSTPSVSKSISSTSSSSSSFSTAPSTTSTSSATSSTKTSSSSTSSVAPSSTSTSSTAPTSSTSSAAPTTTAKSSSSSAAPTSTSASSTLITSTLKTSTTSSAAISSSTSKSTSTATTTTASASASTISTFFSLTSCPSLTTTLGLLLPLPYKFTPYYSGAGYTENALNPGNLAPALFPAQTYSIAGTNTACAAAQACLANIKALAVPHLSVDLHYSTASSSWTCVAYAGWNILPAYFNVPNAAVSYAYGLAGVLSS